ncbi:hypothetical protein Q0F99_19025 [Rathayibacter oskolensis]|nr:hypothetical protein [Rathayibacter oskolensis]WKK71433.1 hypothetical protein Q0F99_19025 [Rathayibacter oskolensis]
MKEDDRIARDVIEEDEVRSVEDMFRDITDPIKREFKRKPKDET